jgi:hypothetical protein
VGPKAGLDAVENDFATAWNRTPAIQPVARRYTRVPEVISLEVKQAGRESDYSPSSSAEV